MPDYIISPDGKWLWTGSEWIPAPPTGELEQISISDNIVSDDPINTRKSTDNLAYRLMRNDTTSIPPELKKEILTVKKAVPNANETEILEAFIRSRDEFDIPPKKAVIGIIEFFERKTKSGIKIEVNPVSIPVEPQSSISDDWHYLFVKDSVDCWEGDGRYVRKNMTVGRLIVAKEGIIFISSGSAKMGRRASKFLISPLWAAWSGPSTKHLDSTDLSKKGSLKISRSDVRSFRMEGGFWGGRYLRIHSGLNGVLCFSTKPGFNKSDAKILQRLEITDSW